MSKDGIVYLCSGLSNIVAPTTVEKRPGTQFSKIFEAPSVKRKEEEKEEEKKTHVV